MAKAKAKIGDKIVIKRLAEGESVHFYEIEGSEPIAYVLPRELYDLLQQVYETGQANVDCVVDGHSYIGC